MKLGQIQEGDYFLIPTDELDLPTFLRKQDICGRMARVTALPQDQSELVEMESYINKDQRQEAIKFHISLEVLEQLQNLGLPS